MLFPRPFKELGDDEAEAAVREALIAPATGLSRVADTFLAAQAARVLVDRLRLSGIILCEAAELAPRDRKA
jgi:hypothetical protein